jgi:hypothetical protein
MPPSSCLHSRGDEGTAGCFVKRYTCLFVFALVLAVAHFFYSWQLSGYLFELRGGVQKLPNGWTSFGGIDWAWTCPIYLPACTVFEVGDRLHGPRPAPQPYGQIGMLLILVGSLVAGWIAASFVVAVSRRERPVLGKYLWRLWFLLIGWGWVLVPVEFSWVYRWTIIY